MLFTRTYLTTHARAQVALYEPLKMIGGMGAAGNLALNDGTYDVTRTTHAHTGPTYLYPHTAERTRTAVPAPSH